jgi:ATP-dependent Clp protease adaptor protein ClpS
MPESVTAPQTKTKPKVERPKLYKVILVNDDFTQRNFVCPRIKPPR